MFTVIYLFIYVILFTEEDCGTVETFVCIFNYLFTFNCNEIIWL